MNKKEQTIEERFEKEFEDNYQTVLSTIIQYLKGKITEEEKRIIISDLDKKGMDIYRNHIQQARQERDKEIVEIIEKRASELESTGEHEHGVVIGYLEDIIKSFNQEKL